MSEDQKPRSGPSTRFFRGFILYFLLNLLFAGQSHSAEASTSHKFITLIGSAGRDFDRVSLTLELSLNIINSSKLLESSIYSAAGLQLRHVRLTGHVASDVAILDAAASTTALAITIGSESALLARLLSQREIPVMAIDSGDIQAQGSMVSFTVTPGIVSESTLALLHRFEWTTIALVYSAQYTRYLSYFSGFLNSSGILIESTHLVSLDVNNPNAALASIVTNLERRRSRVIVCLTDWSDLHRLMHAIRETTFEFVWTVAPEARSAIREASPYFSSLNHTEDSTKAILAVHMSQNFTAQLDLKRKLIAANTTLFPVSEPEPLDLSVTSAHDSIMLWGYAIQRIVQQGGNESDATQIMSQLRQLNPPLESVLPGGNYTFSAQTGLRVGTGHITNLRHNDSYSAKLRVGNFVQGTNLILQEGSIIFANGRKERPASVATISVVLGLLWPRRELDPSAYASYFDAAQLAVDNINANASIIPGRLLRTIYYDNNDTISETIFGGIELESRGAVALIGPDRSSHAIALQYYAGGTKLPAVSFAATSDTLSDQLLYPTFFRTIIPDRYQGRALAGVLQQFSWEHICVMHFVDDYASNIILQLVTEGNRGGRHLDVLGRYTFRTTTTDFSEGFDTIQSAECKIVVCVVDNILLPLIIRQATERRMFGSSGGVQWIFTEVAAVGMQRESLLRNGLNPSDFNGVLVTQPLDAPTDSLLHSAFVSQFLNRTNTIPGPYSTFLYDAIFAVARACGDMIRRQLDPALDRQALLDSIGDQSFEGISGSISFDANGDRVAGVYGLYNYQDAVGGLVRVGYWTPSLGIILTDQAIFYDGTSNIPTDRRLAPIVNIFFSDVGAATVIVITTFCLFLIFIVTISAIVIWRNNKLIRRSSPAFLVTIILGLCLALASVFFWFGPPSLVACHLRIWLGFLGCALAYTALLAKNWRLFFLYNEPSIRVISISNMQLFGRMALTCAPLILSLALWSGISPFQIQLQSNAASTLRYQICASSHDRIFAPINFAYMGLLFVVGAFLSFKTRVLPDTFRESSWIAMATYNLLFVTVVGIVVGYILSFEPSAYPYIVTICILFAVAVTWALLFLPKFWLILFHPDEIDKASSHSGRVKDNATSPHRSDTTHQSAFSLSWRSSHSNFTEDLAAPAGSTPRSQRSVKPARKGDNSLDDDPGMSETMSRRSGKSTNTTSRKRSRKHRAPGDISSNSSESSISSQSSASGSSWAPPAKNASALTSVPVIPGGKFREDPKQKSATTHNKKSKIAHEDSLGKTMINMKAKARENHQLYVQAKDLKKENTMEKDEGGQDDDSSISHENSSSSSSL